MPSPAGSATAAMWETLFEVAGIADEVRWTYGSWRETYDALRGNSVDCIPSLLTNGRPAPILSELVGKTPVRFLPIPQEIMAKAQEINPGIMFGPIPGGAVEGIGDATQSASFSGVLAASPDVSEDVAYQIMQAIFDHSEQVQALGVQFRDIDPEFGAEYLLRGFPVHKGAARYYKENGLWSDSLTEAE
jgi:TRAP transporter TAXI family solute receptor